MFNFHKSPDIIRSIRILSQGQGMSRGWKRTKFLREYSSTRSRSEETLGGPGPVEGSFESSNEELAMVDRDRIE